MRGRLSALAVLGVVWLPLPSLRVARADDLAVTLTVDPCVDIAPARLEELLALELRVLTESGGPAPPGLTRAQVACLGPAVILTVSDRRGGTPAARQLDDWSAYPVQGRPRLLALALSEMIARAWASEAAPPPIAVRPLPAAAPAAPTAAPPGPQLGVLAAVERLGRPRETAAGLDLVLAWPARAWLVLELGARASATSFETAPGAVTARTLSVVAAALAGPRRGRVWVGAGPGLRGGWAWLRGQPSGADPTSRTLAAAWWGPLIAAVVAIELGRRWCLLGAVEGGWVARPLVGQVGPTALDATVALDQIWLTAATGLAWRF